MYRGYKRYAVLLLLLYIFMMAVLPLATAEFEFRRQIQAGDVLYNNEITILPIFRALFHQQTLATTDTEAFSLSPLVSAEGNGLGLSQTSDSTMVATETGLFAVTLPYIWLPEYPSEIIGDGLNWVQSSEPIRFAGLSANQMMIFPQMTQVTRMPNVDGPENDFTYAIDNNNSIPFPTGNTMLVNNVTNGQGQDETVLERPPHDYMTLFASPEQVANKTILERMWRDVHLNYNLDRAYVGRTAYPDLIYPIKDTLTLMPTAPDEVSIRGALNMTKPGMHMRRILWPVGA